MSGSLIELRQPASQICRIPFFTRHLLQTSGHLTKGLCPAGCRICHQCHRVSHITEVFCDRDSGVNRSLTGCHRHIRCICNQNRSLHQRLACLWILQLRKFIQNIRHLISTLSTSDIHHNICLCPFCKLMLNDSFTASERSRHGCHTTLCNREERIDHTLPGYKRHLRRKLSLIRTPFTDRPFLHQGKLSVLRISGNNGNHFLNRKFSCFDLFDRPFYSIRNHDLLLYHRRLLDRTDHISCFDFISDFNSRNKLPFQISFQRRNFHTTLQTVA